MDKVGRKRSIILIVMLGALTVYTYMLRYRDTGKVPAPSLAVIPKSVSGYHATDEYIEPASLRLLGADATLARSYRNSSGSTVELFLGFFAAQQENSQIHSPKHCYPGAGWDILSEGSIDVRLKAGTFPVKRLIISDGEKRQLVIYWFFMQGRVVPNEFALKYQQMKSALLSKPQAASFIRFSAALPDGGEDSTQESLTGFITDLAVYIEDALNSGGQVRPERG